MNITKSSVICVLIGVIILLFTVLLGTKKRSNKLQELITKQETLIEYLEQSIKEKEIIYRQEMQAFEDNEVHNMHIIDELLNN